jgi:hypothetical protein
MKSWLLVTGFILLLIVILVGSKLIIIHQSESRLPVGFFSLTLSAPPSPLHPCLVEEFIVTTTLSTITVKPGRIITVTLDDVILIRAVTSPTCEEELLVFDWSTGRGEIGKARRATNSYWAPDTPGPDFILVVMLDGDGQVGKDHVFVTVKE